MSKIKNKTSLLLILTFSIFALFTAYFIQHVLGHQPCNLCLIERIPYIIAILIILLCLIFKKFEKFLIFVLGVIFFFLTILSIYHFGIEQGFISESLVCNLSTEIQDVNKDTILKELSEQPISCKDVTFKILGLSLATINIFISLIFTIIIFKLFLKYEKN